MGAFASRRNHGVEEVDIVTTNAYRYPPKSGCYFGSHFIMGGDRFETTQPESYLFGENQDLNFLGNRPIPFPYPAPQAHEPTKTLKSLVNIRKESLKFSRIVNEDDSSNASTKNSTPVHTNNTNTNSTDDQTEDTTSVTSQSNPEEETEQEEDVKDKAPELPNKYNIEFTLDTDVKCAITIYYFATEEISNKQAIYRPRDPSMNSETFHYKRGANQTFCQTTHIVEPDKFSEEEWQYNPDKEVIPVVIQCVVEEDEYIGHSHMTFAVVEKVDAGYVLKALKQKQMVDGLCYLLQEIYGIENKNIDRPKQDDDLEDTSSECVICLVEMRDTLILPCRHLCLCNCCADNLRYQASNCPICRSPFRALLQIRAMRKKTSSMPLSTSRTATTDQTSVTQEGIPPGYEAVSLIEALNGPVTHNTTLATTRRSYPDATGRMSNSNPTSPEESPLMSRRRIKRRTSTGSNRSRQSQRSHGCIEEGTEVTEGLVGTEDGDDMRTSVSSLNKVESSKKSPNKSKKSNKHSKSTLKKPAEVQETQFDDIKVDVVDETIKPSSPRSPAKKIVGAGIGAGDTPDNPEKMAEASDAGYETINISIDECSDQSKRDRPKSESDYETIDTAAMCDITDIQFKPKVVSDGDSEAGDTCISLNVETTLSTSHPDGSGSSYSSTESSKGLLDHPDLTKDKVEHTLDPQNA